MHRFQHRTAHGEGSGLVQNDGVKVAQALKSFSSLEEDSKLRAAAHRNGERGRHGQPHGAGAGYDQHSHRVGQRRLKRVRGSQPDKKRGRGQRQHHGHEDRAGAVGQPFHGRTRGLSLLDHAGDLCQHGSLAQRFGPASNGAVVVERAGKHAAAGLTRQGRGLAGEHRLVHGGAAFQDGRVHREAFAGQDQHAVSGSDLFERNHLLNAVANAACSGRTQPGERVERSQRAALGAAFQRFAQKQESENQQDRVEIDLASIRGPDGGVGGVSKRHARSQAHQRIHVGGPVAQGADGAQIDAVTSPGHHGGSQNQQKPAQRVRRKSIKPGQNAHQSVVQCAHFAPQRHGQQHGAGARGQRCPGLALGSGAKLVRWTFRGIATGKNCVVACRANGINHCGGRSNGRIEDHAGAMGHQIDARGLDPGRRAQSLFHVMLAGCAGHAQHGQGESCCRGHGLKDPGWPILATFLFLWQGWNTRFTTQGAHHSRPWPTRRWQDRWARRIPGSRPVSALSQGAPRPRAPQPPRRPQPRPEPGLRGEHRRRSASHRSSA